MRTPYPSSPSLAVSVVGAVRSYGQLRALDGFDLSVRPGEIVALLGPNGPGKTTAISLLLGLARPERGQVEVLGGDPTHLSVRRRIGSMLQIGAVPETLTVTEHLELAAAWYGDPTPSPERGARACAGCG